MQQQKENFVHSGIIELTLCVCVCESRLWIRVTSAVVTAAWPSTELNNKLKFSCLYLVNLLCQMLRCVCMHSVALVIAWNRRNASEMPVLWRVFKQSFCRKAVWALSQWLTSPSEILWRWPFPCVTCTPLRTMRKALWPWPWGHILQLLELGRAGAGGWKEEGADGFSPASWSWGPRRARVPCGTWLCYFDLAFKIDKLCVVATFQ